LGDGEAPVGGVSFRAHRRSGTVSPAQRVGWFRDRRIRSFTHRIGPTMDVVETPIDKLVPYARNPRRNEEAVATVAASLAEFGWRQPIVVDEDMVIVVGHTRYEAAKRLGMTSVPVHVAHGLTPAQLRAYRLMDN